MLFAGVLDAVGLRAHTVASAYAFSPGTVNAEDATASVAVTGRGLSTSDVVVLEPLAANAVTASCTGGGNVASVALTVGGSVGGSAGARTLAASTPTASTLTTPGNYAVCVKFNGTGSFVAVSSTVLVVGS